MFIFTKSLDVSRARLFWLAGYDVDISCEYPLMKNHRLRLPIVLAMVACFDVAIAAPECVLELDQVPAKNVTQVWSPLFQATWEQLMALHAGKLVNVEPPNERIKGLQEFSWERGKVMPENAYAVFAGPATKEFAFDTADAIKKKFGVVIDPSAMQGRPNGHAVFGILLRELRFARGFYRSRKNPLPFESGDGKKHDVAFFGTAGSYSGQFEDHVKVLAYKDHGASFVLSIETQHEGEDVVIYRPPQSVGFRAAIESVNAARLVPLSGQYGSIDNGSLHRKDTVAIPYLTIDARTEFASELSGALHFEGEKAPWLISRAYQMTQFELLEDGARVRIEAGADADPFGPVEPAPKPPPIIPRKFICDRPFFVFLWKTEAAWPYLAVWVDGRDCLTPFIRQ